VRDREAGNARERQLDDRDLADERAPSSETMSAWRKSHGSTTSATAHAAAPMTALRVGCSGRGTIGRRFSISSPRPGRLAPRQNIAMTITTNTNSCQTPGSAMP
jgi:hypothetical protein